MLGALTDLTLRLHRPMELHEMLQLIADRAAQMIQTPLVSIRLLDPAHRRLVATCRVGRSFHRDREWAYGLGQGLVGWVAEHAEPLRLGRAEDDPRFLARPDQERPIGSFLGVPMVSDGLCTGVLSAAHPAFDYFTGEHEQQLVLLASLVAPRIEQSRRARVAQLDELTGVLNRRGLDAHLPAILEDDRTPHPLSIVVADLDATADDAALERFASVLCDSVRDTDTVARLGDRRFLVVLPGTSLPLAERIATRIRGQAGATVAIGAAERAPGEGRDELVARAAPVR